MPCGLGTVPKPLEQVNGPNLIGHAMREIFEELDFQCSLENMRSVKDQFSMKLVTGDFGTAPAALAAGFCTLFLSSQNVNT